MKIHYRLKDRFAVIKNDLKNFRENRLPSSATASTISVSASAVTTTTITSAASNNSAANSNVDGNKEKNDKTISIDKERSELTLIHLIDELLTEDLDKQRNAIATLKNLALPLPLKDKKNALSGHAHVILGACYEFGLDIDGFSDTKVLNPNKTKEAYRIAREQNSVLGLVYYADIFYFGECNTAVDKNFALTLYHKAMDEFDYSAAYLRLSWEHKDRQRYYLELAHKRGSIVATMELGKLYCQGSDESLQKQGIELLIAAAKHLIVAQHEVHTASAIQAARVLPKIMLTTSNSERERIIKESQSFLEQSKAYFTKSETNEESHSMLASLGVVFVDNKPRSLVELMKVFERLEDLAKAKDSVGTAAARILFNNINSLVKKIYKLAPDQNAVLIYSLLKKTLDLRSLLPAYEELVTASMLSSLAKCYRFGMGVKEDASEARKLYMQIQHERFRTAKGAEYQFEANEYIAQTRIKSIKNSTNPNPVDPALIVQHNRAYYRSNTIYFSFYLTEPYLFSLSKLSQHALTWPDMNFGTDVAITNLRNVLGLGVVNFNASDRFQKEICYDSSVGTAAAGLGLELMEFSTTIMSEYLNPLLNKLGIETEGSKDNKSRMKLDVAFFPYSAAYMLAFCSKWHIGKTNENECEAVQTESFYASLEYQKTNSASKTTIIPSTATANTNASVSTSTSAASVTTNTAASQPIVANPAFEIKTLTEDAEMDAQVLDQAKILVKQDTTPASVLYVKFMEVMSILEQPPYQDKNGDAEFFKARCYEQGVGVRTDLIKALTWYRRSQLIKAESRINPTFPIAEVDLEVVSDRITQVETAYQPLNDTIAKASNPAMDNAEFNDNIAKGKIYQLITEYVCEIPDDDFIAEKRIASRLSKRLATSGSAAK